MRDYKTLLLNIVLTRGRLKVRAQLVFNIWESRAFIAKGIAQNPSVSEALSDGVIAIGRGSTNAFIVREFLTMTGNSDFEIDLNNYVAGLIDGSLWVSDPSTKTPEVAFYQGTPKCEPMNQTIDNADIIIKGANAIGTDWIAGVLCAHPEGGTIGTIYAKAIAHGKKILVPVSLEKMLPFPLNDIIPNLGGQHSIDYVRGLPVSVFPITGGEIFTELEAFEAITDEVEVHPIGAGGVYGGAGATIFEISGAKEEVEKIIAVFEEIKDTPPLKINIQPH
ncbi:MAG: hypothetical protein ACFE9L_14300 [Candidatus Hodarchaeota archaeon]